MLQQILDFLAYWLARPSPLDERYFILSYYAWWHMGATFAVLLPLFKFVLLPWQERLFAEDKARAEIEYRYNLPAGHPRKLPGPRDPYSEEGRNHWRRFLPPDSPFRHPRKR